MTERIQAGGLQVAKELYDFVNNKAIPGNGVDQAAFWAGFDKLVPDLAPNNKALLAKRDDIQAKIYYTIEGTDGVCWSLAFRAVADDEIIDGAISPLTTLCDETTVTGDLHTLEMTIPSSTHDISQDDLIIVILKRAVDNVTDTNTADAKFIAMEILWN